MLHCFVKETENIYKNGEMTRVSRDWSTPGVERVLNVPVAKVICQSVAAVFAKCRNAQNDNTFGGELVFDEC